MSTAIVLTALILLAAAAVAALRRDKKQGRSSCGGNCASCGACRQASAQAGRSSSR